MKSRRNPISRLSRIRAGLTIGDPSSIGPEIALKAAARLRDLADIVIIGDSRVINRLPGKNAARLPGVSLFDVRNAGGKDFKLGRISAAGGRASIEYLDAALKLWRDKKIDCIVTCPISKEAIYLAGYKYPGHTEYFADKLKSKETVMMLLNDRLRFALVTRHLPLKAVSGKIDAKTLSLAVKSAVRAMKTLFGIKKPKVVVCGLNPHASDNGVIGDEENRVIKPVLKRLSAGLNAQIRGPMSADDAVSKAYRNKYDVVIAMYHDQALIPLKITGKQNGVNLTLGLPLVRTSPLHGTAFDIAQKYGKADPASLISSIKLAVKCARNLKKA